jgi:hypothetical protein
MLLIILFSNSLKKTLYQSFTYIWSFLFSFFFSLLCYDKQSFVPAYKSVDVLGQTQCIKLLEAIKNWGWEEDFVVCFFFFPLVRSPFLSFILSLFIVFSSTSKILWDYQQWHHQKPSNIVIGIIGHVFVGGIRNVTQS